MNKFLINKNINVFDKSYKTLITKEDKSWSSLIITPQSQEYMVFQKPINLLFLNNQLFLGLDLPAKILSPSS